MRGPSSRSAPRPGVASHRSRRGLAVAAVSALLLAACGGTGTDDAPIVDDADETGASEPADAGEPDPGDDAEPADAGDPPDVFADAEVAASCAELEGRGYDPSAEEQPSPDPALTDAEPVTDIEPLDDPALDDPGSDELGDGDAAPQAPVSRLDQVWAWAEREAPDHFGGIWIDPEEGSPTVIGFTDDVDAYAEQVRSAFGEGWWVVEVDTTYEQLESLQEQLNEAELGGYELTEDGHPVPGTVMSSGLRATINRVVVTVFEPDDERVEELTDRYGADAICIEAMTAPTAEDAQPAPWEPAEDADLSATATSIDVLVNENDCASGQTAEDRLVDPEIVYEDDVVIVTIGIVPPFGDQTCPSNPDTPATVELDEPLGDRDLLDGREDPPVRPSLAGER